jgi:hypothetical protein
MESASSAGVLGIWSVMKLGRLRRGYSQPPILGV